MDGFNSAGGEGGFQLRSRTFNDPGDRGAPPPSFSNANGILSRPPPQLAPLQREESGPGHSNRGPGEVFMVREASRSSLNSVSVTPAASVSAAASDRLPFTGASTDPLKLAEQTQAASVTTTSSTSRHHRSDRDKDAKLVLPKMLKIAVVGDSTSGKTAICNAFTSEGYSFSRNYHMTAGVSIYAKSIKLPKPGEAGSAESTATTTDDSGTALEPRINLVLADSAGKPLYRELLPQYWDQLDGLALVIDLTSTSALEGASAWLNLAKECIKVSKSKKGPISEDSDQSGIATGKRAGSDQHLLGVLIGSKNDMKEQRVISPKAAQDFAAQHGLQYFECSAKENSGMEEPFFYLAHQWATTSPVYLAEKENLEKETNASTSGGIFAKHSTSNSSSRRSAFSNRQGSSDGF